MPIFEVFSRRLKRQTKSAPDVHQYAEIPRKLRVQIATIVGDALGAEEYETYFVQKNPAWVHLHKTSAAEFGLFQLPRSLDNHRKVVMEFMANEATTEQFLDMVDTAVNTAKAFSNQYLWAENCQIQLTLDQMVADVNQRFREDATGYQVSPSSYQLMRVDSEHLHQEVVLPVLSLLSSKGFEGPDSEYRQAHQHYMHGHYKEALNECLKAYESTMKVICQKNGWTYKPGDTASKLIDVCIRGGLFPAYMQNHFVAVKAALESAIPTVRNKLGAHGQGESVTEVPRFYVEFLLHETATTLLFLFKASEIS